jgi:hypothetical protein
VFPKNPISDDSQTSLSSDPEILSEKPFKSRVDDVPYLSISGLEAKTSVLTKMSFQEALDEMQLVLTQKFKALD